MNNPLIVQSYSRCPNCGETNITDDEFLTEFRASFRCASCDTVSVIIPDNVMLLEHVANLMLRIGMEQDGIIPDSGVAEFKQIGGDVRLTVATSNFTKLIAVAEVTRSHIEEDDNLLEALSLARRQLEYVPYMVICERSRPKSNGLKDAMIRIGQAFLNDEWVGLKGDIDVNLSLNDSVLDPKLMTYSVKDGLTNINSGTEMHPNEFLRWCITFASIKESQR